MQRREEVRSREEVRRRWRRGGEVGLLECKVPSSLFTKNCESHFTQM